MRKPGPKKGSKRGLPVVATNETKSAFIAERARKLYNSPSNTKLDFVEIQTLLQALDVFEANLRPEISHDIIPHTTNAYKYTPIQIFNNTMAYFRSTLEAGQPLTKMGITLFNRLDGNTLKPSYIDKLPKELGFLKDCIDFVEMYMEYTANKRYNPAFNIFWLKNRGWVDKFEIDAHSTQGALTEEERRAAQDRIKKFSEAIPG